MPVRRGHVAPRTTIIETIIRKFDTHNRSFLVANAQHGLCHIIYCSDGFCRLSGYSRAEVMQRPAVCDFLHGPLTSQHAISVVKEALAVGSEKHFEILYYRKDGEFKYRRVSDLMIIHKDNNKVEFLALRYRHQPISGITIQIRIPSSLWHYDTDKDNDKGECGIKIQIPSSLWHYDIDKDKDKGEFIQITASFWHYDTDKGECGIKIQIPSSLWHYDKGEFLALRYRYQPIRIQITASFWHYDTDKDEYKDKDKGECGITIQIRANKDKGRIRITTSFWHYDTDKGEFVALRYRYHAVYGITIQIRIRIQIPCNKGEFVALRYRYHAVYGITIQIRITTISGITIDTDNDEFLIQIPSSFGITIRIKANKDKDKGRVCGIRYRYHADTDTSQFRELRSITTINDGFWHYDTYTDKDKGEYDTDKDKGEYRYHAVYGITIQIKDNDEFLALRYIIRANTDTSQFLELRSIQITTSFWHYDTDKGEYRYQPVSGITIDTDNDEYRYQPVSGITIDTDNDEFLIRIKANNERKNSI
ncbi:hypothetical protein L9F63_015870, partial [Diploptera punctata]